MQKGGYPATVVHCVLPASRPGWLYGDGDKGGFSKEIKPKTLVNKTKWCVLTENGNKSSSSGVFALVQINQELEKVREGERGGISLKYEIKPFLVGD